MKIQARFILYFFAFSIILNVFQRFNSWASFSNDESLQKTIHSDASSEKNAPLTLFDQDNWKVILKGFVELDMVVDSTRSLSEIIGNSPVDLNGTVAGANGRTQFSIRNTRLGLTLYSPQISGWKSRALIEADFFGFNPNSTGSTASLNSEANLFNNPTLRLRHAYMQSERGSLNILAGQTWNLFGWQPYYFMSTADVLSLPGLAFGRSSQLRAMETLNFSNLSLQMALALARPPQRDSMYPDLQGGVRMTFKRRSSGFTGNGAGPIITQPMSIGISGLARQFSIPNSDGTTNSATGVMGMAYAADIMIPIIPSSNGKDVSNTLSFSAEFTSGTGYGDQFLGWTGNTSNPLNSSSVSPTKSINLDGGIGDYDANGNFYLINLTSANAHLQYHFPAGFNTFANIGAGMIYSDNIGNLLPSGSLTSAGRVPYNRDGAAFFNVFHYFTEQFRIGLEFAHIETTYTDGSSAFDNRYQLTWLFIL